MATKSHTPDFFQQKVDFAQTFRHGHQTTLKFLENNANFFVYFDQNPKIFSNKSAIKPENLTYTPIFTKFWTFETMFEDKTTLEFKISDQKNPGFYANFPF